MENIIIHGARIHNLKNIDLSMPKEKITVITGVSGSGKSSLAFDIIFEEGKNRYLQSIGILSELEREKKYDFIDGIGPTVCVKQNTVRQNNPRSTVGTKTGILYKLAMIYSSDAKKQTDDGQHLLPNEFMYTNTNGMCFTCQGMGSYYDVNIEALIPNDEVTLQDIYEAEKVTRGYLRILQKKYASYLNTPYRMLPEKIKEEIIYGTYENGKQTYCLERKFKNSLQKGEDVETVYIKKVCPKCKGERISKEASGFLLEEKRFGELGNMTITELYQFLTEIPNTSLTEFSILRIREILENLKTLIKYRLGHLSLYRELSTLSGGELQRLFLYMHLESQMDSLIYVFDEPLSGLHVSEKQEVIEALKKLRDHGNTIIVVEHDKEMMRHADHIVEVGPNAGIDGGTIVYEGDYVGYKESNTILSRYLDSNKSFGRHIPAKLHQKKLECVTIRHANKHNLKDITVEFPLHQLIGVAGVSGSGKSSLIEDCLLARLKNAKKYNEVCNIEGTDYLNGVVQITQEPIGKSSLSTPSSYIGIWDKIRAVYAKQEDALKRGFDAGYFSFHSKGACSECGGSGYEKIFLSNNFTVNKICKVCNGTRFCNESLMVTYQGKTIAEVLELSISDAIRLFQGNKAIVEHLLLLQKMGLGYMKLGQPTSTLSGGEAQRVKLAKELIKKLKGHILYVLDEPTTGLSLYDVELLMNLLHELIDQGNSVIVIEHNIEVLKQCDHIIELGPEGGENGGRLIACGTPMELAKNLSSKTGRYL